MLVILFYQNGIQEFSPQTSLVMYVFNLVYVCVCLCVCPAHFEHGSPTMIL